MRYLFAILILFSTSLFAQQNAIRWITFNQMAKMQAIEKRPVLVDVYTDWCGWCKRLDATTYQDPNIVNYINSAFYAVKFNAEGYDTIIFQGKQYLNRGAGAQRSTHELARYLMGSELSYPTTIFLNPESTPTLIVPGYQAPNDMVPFLVYNAEHLNETANVSDFANDFHKAFGPYKNDSTKVNWLSMKQALEMQKRKPKKILVHLKNSNYVSDRVMMNSTFVSQTVIDSLNKNYYCVDFDVLSGDSISFQNRTFINVKPGAEIHQLAYGLMQNQIGFPSMVIINEEQLVIAPIKQYITEKHMTALLHYFSANAFQKMSFNDWTRLMYQK